MEITPLFQRGLGQQGRKTAPKDGLETDKGRRFAMWSLLYMLGSAPDLDVAFKDPRDREAARTFMDLLDQANAGELG